MPPSPEQIVRAYQTRLLAIRARTGQAVGRAWTRANVDEAAAQRFIAAAATISTAGQSAAGALVDGYIALLLGQAPQGIETPQIRNGTEPAEVYTRAIVTARTALADGTPWVDAMASGGARAVSSAETDVMLAQRQAFVDLGTDLEYRRVLTGRSCMFCATVSTQTYHSRSLMPIHSHCDCTIAPIVEGHDPGRTLNSSLLKALKASGGSQYWKARGLVDIDEAGFHVANPDGTARVLEVTTRHHGELGPVLVDRSQAFAGPSVVAA